LALKIDIDQKLKGLMIYFDEGRIKQILLNLISNSFKFTFYGSITIFVTIEESNAQEFLKLSVSDTGIGIKEEDQGKLFKLFGMIIQKQMSINPNG
jgi:signal transduction histidine kinase